MGNKRVLFFLAVSLVITANLRAEEEISVTRSQCADLKGRVLWESKNTTAAIPGKAGHYLMTEEGKGDYSDFKGRTSNRSEFEFINDGKVLLPVHLKRQVFSEQGKLIFEETQTFVSDRKQVDCEVRNLITNVDKKKSFEYKGDIINDFLMGSYIRKFLHAGEKEKTVYFVNDGPGLYRITLKVIDKEEITVRGKKREAYKICIDPRIGLLSPAKVFLTKNYAWYSAQPPYEWIMFKGLESSLDSPQVEIISLDD